MKFSGCFIGLSLIGSLSASAAQFDCTSAAGLLYRADTSYGEIAVLDGTKQSLWYGDGYEVAIRFVETAPPMTVHEFRHHEDSALDMVIRERATEITAEFLADTDRNLKNKHLDCTRR